MALPKTGLLVHTFDLAAVQLVGASTVPAFVSSGQIGLGNSLSGSSTVPAFTSAGSIQLVTTLTGSSTVAAFTSNGVISTGIQPPYGFEFCIAYDCLSTGINVLHDEIRCCP